MFKNTHLADHMRVHPLSWKWLVTAPPPPPPYEFIDPIELSICYRYVIRHTKCIIHANGGLFYSASVIFLFRPINSLKLYMLSNQTNVLFSFYWHIFNEVHNHDVTCMYWCPRTAAIWLLAQQFVNANTKGPTKLSITSLLSLNTW